jgi:hypothetical protein
MSRLVLSTTILLAVSLITPAAFGQRAQLYLSQANIPARLSEQGLRNFLRSHQARMINEESDHRTWKFKVGTFFRGSPGDLEAHLLFYDVEHGSRIFVTEMTVFLSNRDETAFLQNVTLMRPMFKPRNRYICVLTIRRNEMASANFELVGLQAERTGRVEFSDQDTQDPGELSIAQQNAAAEAQRVAIAREQARQQEFEQARREEEAERARAAAAAADDTEGGGEETAEDVAVREEAARLQLAGSNTPQSGGCASCAAGPGGPGTRGLLAALSLLGLCALVLCRAR